MRLTIALATALAAALLAATPGAALVDHAAEATWTTIAAADQAAAGDAFSAKATLENYADAQADAGLALTGDAVAYAVEEGVAAAGFGSALSTYAAQRGAATAGSALASATAVVQDPQGTADGVADAAEGAAALAEARAEALVASSIEASRVAAAQAAAAAAYAAATAQHAASMVPQPALPPVPALPLVDDAGQCFAATGGSTAATLGVSNTWTGVWGVCSGAQADVGSLLG